MNDRSREWARAARQTEAGYVLLATWIVLAILGASLIFTDISLIIGAVMIFPLPVALILRFIVSKKMLRLREMQVREHNRKSKGNEF